MQVHGNRNRKAYLSEINVTPLVDVMLVLLIIFMVTAPMMTQGIDVNLPDAKGGELGDRQKKPLIVTVSKNGEIYIDDSVILPDALKTRLEMIHENDGTEQVLLRADRDVAYGSVANVMALIRESGISSIGLVTRAEKNSTAPDNDREKPDETAVP